VFVCVCGGVGMRVYVLNNALATVHSKRLVFVNERVCLFVLVGRGGGGRWGCMI